jgi:hypothetical protein
MRSVTNLQFLFYDVNHFWQLLLNHAKCITKDQWCYLLCEMHNKRGMKRVNYMCFCFVIVSRFKKEINQWD